MQLALSPEQYRLVKVPPGVWNGFTGTASYPSLVCNCATIPHDPDEMVREPPDDPAFPYDWGPGRTAIVPGRAGRERGPN
jgi:dTDP-4-dehydrorhamnose 3,5-epimerase